MDEKNITLLGLCATFNKNVVNENLKWTIALSITEQTCYYLDIFCIIKALLQKKLLWISWETLCNFLKMICNLFHKNKKSKDHNTKSMHCILQAPSFVASPFDNVIKTESSVREAAKDNKLNFRIQALNICINELDTHYITYSTLFTLNVLHRL